MNEIGGVRGAPEADTGDSCTANSGSTTRRDAKFHKAEAIYGCPLAKVIAGTHLMCMGVLDLDLALACIALLTDVRTLRTWFLAGFTCLLLFVSVMRAPGLLVFPRLALLDCFEHLGAQQEHSSRFISIYLYWLRAGLSNVLRHEELSYSGQTMRLQTARATRSRIRTLQLHTDMIDRFVLSI